MIKTLQGDATKGSCSRAHAGRPCPFRGAGTGSRRPPPHSGTSEARPAEQPLDESRGHTPVLAVCSEGQLSAGGRGRGLCGAGGGRRGRGGQRVQDRGRGRSCFPRPFLSLDTEPWPCPSLPQGPGIRGPEPVPRQPGETPPPQLARASPGPVGRGPCSGAHEGVRATSRSAQAHPAGSVPASLP